MPGRTESSPKRLPVYAIGHAGVSVLWQESKELVRDNMRSWGEQIKELGSEVKALLIISGHFEGQSADHVEVNVKAKTEVMYDYNNDFSRSAPFAYELVYPHLDDPQLAEQVLQHLEGQGFPAKRVERDLDHGAWVISKVAFPPYAPLQVPIVQVSTFVGANLDKQIALGHALAGLRAQGFVIIGSGMAVHDFPGVRRIRKDPYAREEVFAYSRTFDQALRDGLARSSQAEREAAWLALEKREDFALAHPTAEHLTPFYVALGAAAGDNPTTFGRDLIEPGFSYTNWVWA